MVLFFYFNFNDSTTYKVLCIDSVWGMRKMVQVYIIKNPFIFNHTQTRKTFIGLTYHKTFPLSSWLGGSFPCSLNTFCLLFKRSAHRGFWLSLRVPLLRSDLKVFGAATSGCHAIKWTRRFSTFWPQTWQIPGSFWCLWIFSMYFAYASFPWCLNKCFLK